MIIRFIKTFGVPELTVPKGREGEKVTWEWWGGRGSHWERDEDGNYPGWHNWQCLKAKLHEWDEREKREEEQVRESCDRMALIELGVFSTNGKEKQYQLAVEVGEGSDYETWSDLLELIDYLIVNEAEVLKTIEQRRRDIIEGEGRLAREIIERKIASK